MNECIEILEKTFLLQ